MPSPYVLIITKVRGYKLPAITHLDGSTYIQTFDESCSVVWQTLEVFNSGTRIPFLMKTSFNTSPLSKPQRKRWPFC
jgi:predicted NodU family carbamoyl transferase